MAEKEHSKWTELNGSRIAVDSSNLEKHRPASYPKQTVDVQTPEFLVVLQQLSYLQKTTFEIANFAYVVAGLSIPISLSLR